MTRWAEWAEQAVKMKMRRDNVVLLPTQIVELISDLQRLTGRSRYLIPSSGEKVPEISDASINKCFALIGYKGRMTGHGSRHNCEILLSEFGWDENWRHMHLAHKKAGLKGVYGKAIYLPQRKKMVQWYADYLDALREAHDRTTAGRVRLTNQKYIRTLYETSNGNYLYFRAVYDKHHRRGTGRPSRSYRRQRASLFQGFVMLGKAKPSLLC